MLALRCFILYSAVSCSPLLVFRRFVFWLLWFGHFVLAKLNESVYLAGIEYLQEGTRLCVSIALTTAYYIVVKMTIRKSKLAILGLKRFDVLSFLELNVDGFTIV